MLSRGYMAPDKLHPLISHTVGLALPTSPGETVAKGACLGGEAQLEGQRWGPLPMGL